MDNNKNIQPVSRNNNPLRSSSEQWLQYFKQAKIDLEEINKALLNNVETVDNENIKLKEAIRELISDLQEKEVSLEQSQKIIMKLKEEYTKLIIEYQNIETSNQKLEAEIANIKKQFENTQKSYSSYDKVIKQNENLKTENEILKKDNSNLKNLLSNKSIEYNKKEKECNDKEILLNDIKAKNENWINMIKEREKLIQDYSKRIEELNETIVNKDNQLKVMVNFSKSINNENKTNVKELTKQAVQTIKLFYNTLNLHNNDSSIESNQSNCNYIDILYKEDDKYFDNILNDKKENIEKKISTKLKDGLACVMYIPNTVKAIAKEFLIDMNFKNELMKYELFSSYLREFQIVAFLKGIFSKVSIDKETKSSMSFDDICAKVILLKKGYEDLVEENYSLKKEITLFKQKNEELNLYIDKTKKDSKNVINNIREKVNIMEKGYIDKIDELKSTIQRIKVKNNKDSQVLKNEIELTRNKLSKLNSYQTYEISRKDIQVLTVCPIINFSYKGISKSSNSSSRNLEIRTLPNASNNNQVCLTFQPPFESSRANTSGNNNLSFQLNDSFNEKNYKLKKIENEHLKDEISRLKNEIGTLLLEMNSQREKPIQCKKCNDLISFITKDMSFDSFMKILNFYMNLSCEIQKISNNTNEIFNQITKAEDKFFSSDKTVKLSQIHSLFIEMQKLFSLITNSLNKFSKYNITFSSELQKLFALISQYIYSKPLPLQNITQIEYNIINISDLNKKVFSSSEYNKIYSIYQSISIEDIIPTFISKSNEISQLILNFNIDCDSELSATDREDNNILLDLSTELALSNSSYKVVSNEIKKLKRRDIENKVICEIVKHYLIALELICIKSNYNIDMINQIYKIYEELTMYKIDDIDDDGIFIRKTYLKCFLLLKWQIVPFNNNI